MGQWTTVVFADVEGSTSLLTRVGDVRGLQAIEQVLSTVHDRIEPYGGRFVKSLGDGVMVTFDSPRAAVSFAVATQLAADDRRPRLRFGMHFGETGGGDDPLGETVNAAARIADKANGGEIVVSDVVRQLAGSMPGVRFVDRGRTALKGFPDRWSLHRAVPAASTPATAAVFGRDDELVALDEALVAATCGTGQITLLVGEAGVGKSHLGRALTDRARDYDIRVLTGGADELEQDRPGRILTAVTEDLGVSLTTGPATGVDDASTHRAADPAYAVVERFIDAVESAASAGPVLLFLEDLHWADELSLRGIAALARRVTPLPVVVVGTLRPAPRSAYLDRVLEICDDGGAVSIRLDGLDERAVAGLVASLTGATPGPGLRERLAATAGNPLFVTELIRCLEDDDELVVESGVAETGVSAIPADLADLVLRRLGALPTVTAETLRLASILGSEFLLADLAAVAGRSVTEVAADLRPALDAGLLAGARDRLSFCHDLVREAVHLDIAPAVRTDLHLAAARSLAAAGTPVTRVATQYALGARAGDLQAAQWLCRAAVEVSGVDAAAAANFYEKALDVAPVDWDERGAVESRRIELLAWAGRIDEARDLAQALLDRSLTSSEIFRAKRALGTVLATVGDLPGAATHLLEAAELAEGTATDGAVVRTAAFGMQVIAGVRSPGDVLASVPSDTEDPILACVDHNTLAVAAAADGAYDRMLGHARTARSLMEAHYVPSLGFVIPHTWLPTAHYNLDDFDAAAETGSYARRWAEEHSNVGLLIHALAVNAGVQWAAGEWDEAMTDVDAARNIATETGADAETMLFGAIAALIHLGRGELAAAEAEVVAGEAFFAGRSLHLFGLDLLLLARARLLEAAGETEAAADLLFQVWEQAGNLRGLNQWRSLGPDLARLSRASGHGARAAAVATEAEAIAGRSSSVSAAAAALRARAHAEGDPDALLAATALLRGTPRRTDLAATCREAGALLVEVDRGPDALTVLEEAAVLCARLGATGDVAVVDALLDRAGGRSMPKAVRPTHGWDALSPKELEVVALVADGCSNPAIAEALFISRRTVETHISHVFRKLDLSNRTQLAAAAIQHGVV